MTRRRIRTEYSDLAVVTGARTVHIDYEPVVDIHGRVMTIANVARASYGGSPATT